MALGLVVTTCVCIWCLSGIGEQKSSNRLVPIPQTPVGAETITLGGGCFWHMQDVLEHVPGVLSVTVGYMGGTTKYPTYENLSGTGHTEVSRVVYDPKQTSLEKILQAFWKAHRPTTPVSPTARSVIFYYSDEQRVVATRSKDEAAKLFSKPIVTEISKAQEFYPAEEYHQDYYKKHGSKTCGL